MQDGEEVEDRKNPGAERTGEDFGELIRYTVPGYLCGLVLGAVLDGFGLQINPVGQWAVRTLSGEGDSLFEGIFVLRRRLGGSRGSMAEAYGWGKVLGVVFPWIVDLISRALGIDVYGVGGFYIPYLYAMSDQMGASIAGLMYIQREEHDWGKAVGRYLRHPVMLASLTVILVVPVALLFVRLLGFSPTTQVYTAIETIAANLCWIPPLAGWMSERRRA